MELPLAPSKASFRGVANAWGLQLMICMILKGSPILHRGVIIARGFITAVGRLGVLLLRWFGAAQEHAAFKFQLAPLKFAGAARRQGGV